MLLPVIFFDCLPICILSVVQFLVLESIYGTSLRYLPSCSQINQHKHFNYFSREYCNACLFGSYPTTCYGEDLHLHMTLKTSYQVVVFNS
nr:MAG TPA: hypothetical protein [Caudoviricetes sp.]